MGDNFGMVYPDLLNCFTKYSLNMGIRLGGRKKGVPNKSTALKVELRKDYFERIMDDKRETAMWNRFLETPNQDPINWQAFKLAVQYKRGMPIQPVSGEGGGAIKFEFVSNVEFPDPKS